MYNLLKTVDYITAATGSYTIFKHAPITEEQFNSVFGQVESFDEKTKEFAEIMKGSCLYDLCPLDRIYAVKSNNKIKLVVKKEKETV